MQRHPSPDLDHVAGVLDRRSEAAILDTVFLVVTLGVVGFLVGALMGGGTAGGLGTALVFASFGTLVVVPFYYTTLEGYAGQTVGKRIVGIVVVRTDGSRCTWQASVVRNLVRVVDALPAFYLVGILVSRLNDRRQRLGDHAAGTVVVHVR